jgi:hypothetical protein
MERGLLAFKLAKGFVVETARFNELEQRDVEVEVVAEGEEMGLAWSKLGGFESVVVVVNRSLYGKAKVGATALVAFVDERSNERGSGADERAGESGNGGDDGERDCRNFGGGGG